MHCALRTQAPRIVLLGSQAMLVESLAARLADADPTPLLHDLNGAVATPQVRRQCSFAQQQYH